MVGIAIKKIRKNRKLKQKDFAKKIGIHVSTLSSIEQERREPSLKMLGKIADGFGLPLSILFWFGVKKEDVADDKKEMYDILKPSVDKMIFSLFGTDENDTKR